MSIPPDLDPVTLHRLDPSLNMARFYTLSVEVTLLEDWSCTRAYGRIGSRGGRIMIGLHESYDAAIDELHAILRRKKARGYRVV